MTNLKKITTQFTTDFQKEILILVKNSKSLKILLLVLFHVLGALVIAYIVTMILLYLRVIGEISSSGIFVLWQKLASFFLPMLIIFLSIFVVISSNPVYALVSLIVVFFCTAVFLLSINISFLAMIYLIIYIGAIAILFLFVIMMFNLRELKQRSAEINDYSFLSFSFFVYFLILWKFYSLILDNISKDLEYDKYFSDFAKNNFDSLQYYLTYQHLDTLLFGTLLYEYYSFLFILSGLLLLTSMLGSIILALSTTENTINSK